MSFDKQKFDEADKTWRLLRSGVRDLHRAHRGLLGIDPDNLTPAERVHLDVQLESLAAYLRDAMIAMDEIGRRHFDGVL